MILLIKGEPLGGKGLITILFDASHFCFGGGNGTSYCLNFRGLILLQGTVYILDILHIYNNMFFRFMNKEDKKKHWQ